MSLSILVLGKCIGCCCLFCSCFLVILTSPAIWRMELWRAQKANRMYWIHKELLKITFSHGIASGELHMFQHSSTCMKLRLVLIKLGRSQNKQTNKQTTNKQTNDKQDMNAERMFTLQRTETFLRVGQWVLPECITYMHKDVKEEFSFKG